MSPSNHSDNQALRMAYRLAEHTGSNIFLTGKAGTGKTTFLRDLCSRSRKRIVVAAPTGIAAINAQGVTLHSLLQLPFGPFVPGAIGRKPLRFSRAKLALLRSMDMLVIDEVSMVRADLLDSVDDVLRRVREPSLPFGGVQLLLIGDLRQLPPVVKDDEWQLLSEHYPSPFFFHSLALRSAGYITLELDHVYRQRDTQFLALLENVRTGRDILATISTLNERCFPSFTPPEGEHWVQLTTHNDTARRINDSRMAALKGHQVTYNCRVEGNFPENAYPADECLELKPGAQVMFIKNDPSPDKRFYNGMTGTVTDLSDDEVTVAVSGEEAPVVVGFTSWENIRYEVNAGTGELNSVVEGTFSQIPLRPAWAITIHKSQGLTFSHAMIDASASFAHGQAYVALSRCRTLQGLVLTSPLRPGSIINDPTVNRFLEHGRLTRPDGATISRLELEYVAELLDSIFLLNTLSHRLLDFHRVAEEAFRSYMPHLLDRYSEVSRALDKLLQVGRNFAARYRSMLASGVEPISESPLQERLTSGAAYFLEHLAPLVELLDDTPTEHDNKAMVERLGRYRTPLQSLLSLTVRMLAWVHTHSFSTPEFLSARAREIVDIEKPSSRRKIRKESSSAGKRATQPTSGADVQNTGLFNALVAWRRAKSRELNVPPYTIFSTKALISISTLTPVSHADLLQCSGVGKVLANRYGDEILSIVKNSKA